MTKEMHNVQELGWQAHSAVPQDAPNLPATQIDHNSRLVESGSIIPPAPVQSLSAEIEAPLPRLPQFRLA